MLAAFNSSLMAGMGGKRTLGNFSRYLKKKWPAVLGNGGPVLP